MIRALIFLLLILGISLALAGVADEPGRITLTWLGYEIETSIFVALLALALLFGLLILLWLGLRYIVTRPSALSRYLRKRQEEKGLDALSKGLIAIGSGDRDAARHYARLARRTLPDEPLTALLRAQAAQLSGDREEATRIFTAMTEQPGTELLGLRGLFLEASRENETEAARQFAERAMRRNPDLAWSVNALFEMQCRAGDWEGALRTLDVAQRHKHIDRSLADRRRAVLLTAQAREIEDSDSARACELALEAVRLAPDLVPAAEMAGRLLAAQGKLTRARRILSRAWELSPHPDIALAYAHLVPGESPRERLKRVRKLVQGNTGSVEGPVAVATAAIEARDWKTAREALEPLLADNPSARVCTLMARIEAGEHGDEGRVREWLARAVRAPRDPAWTADGYVSERWEPLSPVTGRLDAFEWKVPLLSLGPAQEGAPQLDLPAADAAGGTLAAAPGTPAGAGAAADADRPPAATQDSDVLVIEAETIGEGTGEERASEPSAGEKDGEREASPAVPEPASKPQADGTPEEKPAAADGKPEIFVPPRAPDDPGPDAPEAQPIGGNADEDYKLG
ncbi:MAG: heme biosynthesis HemY N-terminal domain-containing protein [Methyloligellaceae bacterium]